MTDLPVPCCEDDEAVDQGSGFPALPPPCVGETCSIGVLPRNQTAGKLAMFARLFGRSASETITAQHASEGGVLRCVNDPDGALLGLDVALADNPEALNVSCTDADGVRNYVNGIRRVRSADGTYGLGTLPVALQDRVCVEGGGTCQGLYPEGQAGSTYGSSSITDCGPYLETTITNQSCYPMSVTPSISVTGARLGPGPVTYQLQPSIQGQAQSAFGIGSSNGQSSCSMLSAGSGATSDGGEPVHNHDGPAHVHTLECTSGSDNVFSTTVTRAPITLGAGESLQYSVQGSLLYLEDVATPGALDFGQVLLCLDYKSVVTPTTIAALEGTTTQ